MYIKSLFDIISGKLQGSNFLDLYAGTGTVGLEAISRGAGLVVFVDVNPDSINLIKKNISILKIPGEKVMVCRENILAGLNWLQEKFGLVFIGPPYAEKITAQTLKLVSSANILSEGGWIIAQHPKKEPVDVPETGLTMFRREKYGETLLSFFCKQL